MTHTEFFKLQAKNLFRDYQTKTKIFDQEVGDYIYEYSPKYFDINTILSYYDIDEENFSLMKAQHFIAQLVGFRKWADLLVRFIHPISLQTLST